MRTVSFVVILGASVFAPPCTWVRGEEEEMYFEPDDDLIYEDDVGNQGGAALRIGQVGDYLSDFKDLDSGCLIHQPVCTARGAGYEGYFLDNFNGSDSSEARCLQRASEFSQWCANELQYRTTAVFLRSGAIDVYPTYGCAIFQRHCPLKTIVGAKPDADAGAGGSDSDGMDDGAGNGGVLVTAEQSYSGVFFDEHEGSAGNESRCLGRALDFLYWCGSPDGSAARASHVTAVYGVSGSTIAVVPKIDAPDGEGERLDFEYYKGTVRPARVASPIVAGAVSSALFTVATAYAACQSPPLPAASDSSAVHYNCHTRHAEMSVEAMDQHLLYSPEDANAWFNRGVAMYQLTRLQEAAASFTRTLELDPDHASGLAALATIMTQLGGFTKARALLEPRIRKERSGREPGPATADGNGEAVKAGDTDTDAVAAASGPGSAQDIIIWARLAPRFNETESAIAALEELLASEPNADTSNPKLAEAVHFRLGYLYDASGSYRKAWHHYTAANGIVRTGLRQYESMAERVALAKYGSTADPAANFAAVQEADVDDASGGSAVPRAPSSGLDLGASLAPADGKTTSQLISQAKAIQSVYCLECMDKIPSSSWRRPDSDESESRDVGEDDAEEVAVVPIFVVGMPRSGTTLVEQILDRHPSVMAAGEMPSLPVLAPKIFVPRDAGGQPLLEGAHLDPALTSRDLDSVAAAFIAKLKHYASVGNTGGPDEPSGGDGSGHAETSRRRIMYIVSKLPNHYEMLGLIVKLFPDSPIIHCTRDVRDTLLSNYFTRYLEGLPWSYDLEDAADYFLSYRSLMRHWANVIGPETKSGRGLRMLEVRYEDLVCTPKSVADQLADFVGIGRHTAMHTHHESARVAMTSSNEQVRRPVYQSSVGRWKLYDFRASGEEHGDDDDTGFDAAGLLSRIAEAEAEAGSSGAESGDLARSLPDACEAAGGTHRAEIEIGVQDAPEKTAEPTKPEDEGGNKRRWWWKRN